eukprot:6001355-Pyramimonas_sp.AAC.1
MEFARENVLTKPQIEQRLVELKLQEAPQMPTCVLCCCVLVNDFFCCQPACFICEVGNHLRFR